MTCPPTLLQLQSESTNLDSLWSRGQFWLELEKIFAKYDDVHINLRPGGKWAEKESGPETSDDWAKVEDYMGLFEHCKKMLNNKLIDWETFRSIYPIFPILNAKIT